MIGRLRGALVAKHPPQLVIDVGGVGYELEAPMTTFYTMPRLGETVTLFTHLQVREDTHILYAFADDAARRLFRALLKVNGVGAKMALAILSGMDADALARCVRAGDAKALTRLPGVGRKTAERVVLEMRDRLDEVAAIGQVHTPGTDSRIEPLDEAVRALIALGYKPQEASHMVDRVEVRGQAPEEIIRLALKTSLV
jgi:Holliday junction DNA helicase RuvA